MYFMPNQQLKSQPKQIMLIAGEASGDEHAALIVKEFRRENPDAQVFGMGGEKLRSAGMEVILDIKKYASVMGLVEVIKRIKIISQAYKILLAEAKKRKPDLVILVDYPGFNLRIAKDLKRKGFKILYFIAPQIWAWKKGRAKNIRKYVDKVAVIFPFEEDFLKKLGIDAEFVGHPFTDRPPLEMDKQKFLKSLNLFPDTKTLALLPGSRKDEIKKLLVTMFGAYLKLKERFPELQVIIPVAGTINKSWLYRICRRVRYQMRGVSHPGSTASNGKLCAVDLSDIAFVPNTQVREALAVSDIGLIKSGTITMEATFAELPFVVVYKLSPLTHWVGKKIIKGIKNFSMPNIIAGREIVPELLQKQVTPEHIASLLGDLLENETRRNKIVNDLRQVKQQLKGTTGDMAKSMAENMARLAEQLITK